MAIVGLKMVTFGLVDSTGKLITDETNGLSESGILPVDDTYLGSKTADITGLSGTNTKIYGNNKIQDIETAHSEPSVSLEINNLAFDILQKLLGRTSDGQGGYTPSLNNTYVAMLIESQTIDRANSVYFGFAKGTLTQPSQKVGTDTQNQTREDDNLTYTALDSDTFDGMPYKLYYSGDSEFDEDNMLKEVFGGYVASTATTTGSSTTTTTTAR